MTGPVEQFAAERRQRIADYAQDAAFNELSKQWREQAMARQYVYNFNWLGRPIIQYPQDMLAVQELVWRTRPDVIIEAGVAHGGSLVLSASILAMLDLADAAEAGDTVDPRNPKRKVIGIDIDIRAHNREAIEAHPLAGYIQLIEGSSVAPETIAQVHEAASGYGRAMVMLDSMHTHDHVFAELEAYGPLVSSGCYCIVFDTFVEDLPPGFFVDRPWDPGNSPKSAVLAWLEAHPEFEIDREIETILQVTAVPSGYLRRA
ncbi:MAG: cephalosporin hydroxylase family protein [Aeromicrobium sp.]